MDGLISLEAYAWRKGLSVGDVLRSAAIGEVTLCWELVFNATMRPVAEFCPCLSQSEFDEKWEGPVWTPIDPPFPYGQPPSRSGIFRLVLKVNPGLAVIFHLLAQGHLASYIDDEDGIRDSLVLQDTVDEGWWRILGGREENFEWGRLPLVGELMVEPQALAAVAPTAAFTSKPELRVEEIRRWFTQQTEFSRDQLFNAPAGSRGARSAAWGHFEKNSLFQGARGKGKQSRVFENAWSRFKAQVRGTTPKKME